MTNVEHLPSYLPLAGTSIHEGVGAINSIRESSSDEYLIDPI
jgi:hypothetical protein